MDVHQGARIFLRNGAAVHMVHPGPPLRQRPPPAGASKDPNTGLHFRQQIPSALFLGPLSGTAGAFGLLPTFGQAGESRIQTPTILRRASIRIARHACKCAQKPSAAWARSSSVNWIRGIFFHGERPRIGFPRCRDRHDIVAGVRTISANAAGPPKGGLVHHRRPPPFRRRTSRGQALLKDSR